MVYIPFIPYGKFPIGYKIRSTNTSESAVGGDDAPTPTRRYADGI